MMQNENSRKGLILGLIVIGFGIGWAGGVLTNKQPISIDPVAKTMDVDGSMLTNSGNSPELPQQSTITDKVEGISEPGDEARLLELIFSETNDHQVTASRIIEYFELLMDDPMRNPRRNKQLRDLLRSVPELSFALLDQFNDVEDQDVKSQLGLTLMINNSMQRPFLEPKLIEKIKQNEDRSQMLKLLGEWGLQSKSNLQYLQSEMPYMDDPNDLGSAIRAISSSSWVQRSALEPSVMQELSRSIDEYLNSDYPEVRAAAVAAMRTIVPKNYREKLLNSFEDSSELVRREAMMHYLNNPFDSPALEKKLFEKLQDQSLSYKERSSIAFGLERFGLSKEQKKLVKEVQTNLREYAESLSKAEQVELFAE